MVQECFGNASDSLAMLLFAKFYQDPTLAKKKIKMKCHHNIKDIKTIFQLFNAAVETAYSEMYTVQVYN